MFIHLFVFYFLIIPSIVYSQCYSTLSRTWICNDKYKSNNFTYQTILNDQQLENFFLTNYQTAIFRLDNYPLTLRLLNASGNQFQSIIITSKNRYKSKLRQLILESNNIEQFNIDTIVLPNSLEKISLANNKLKIIDARLFTHLNNLIEIDLRNNQLKRILPDLLLKKSIKLNNNPLECQCTTDTYRIMCEKATNIKQMTIESNNCMAPYYHPSAYDPLMPIYFRFSTFILICPISSQPPPIIIWSTPFGNLTSINSTSIDLLSSNNNDEPLYVTLTVLAGPLTARTEHTLHAFNGSHLSVTHARAALQHRISCSGINMLGTYTFEFNFDIQTYMQSRALWQIIYTMGFGFFMALVAGALCVTLKRTHYNGENLKTPPIYPTMAPNSAARTPPNFELNQWLSLAAANISGTLEQVRDKLRLGVQQVSEHMGQTMGRATELFSYGVQHAGGTIRQAAETSAAYLHSFRETSQHRLNTMRVQTLSSLRNPGHLMRAGMNMLTTQVNSLRDYCGVITGHPLPSNYAIQQQQLHDLQHSPGPRSNLRHNQVSTIIEEDESMVESTSLIPTMYRTPYVGHTSSIISANASGIGQLETADNSVLLALNNFNSLSTNNIIDNDNLIARGQMSAGIGTFHGHIHDNDDDLINEPERLIIYGAQRPTG
ncbi:unnamed protein product [Rotaria sp. Silwood1]|nr:unnamed protein product [Rotaria sp. Silwood1]CAF0961626.1 unnamed protein product [Rotaria sp. Silwood1]CAF3338606.1 unnamed protein product [Rotaria sp. Silwood1]CAF3365437.1 unnamed protein product [Rotaria sp. Silwood1]CAF3398480.1 unnamed protein product [Rotaria sp. Silwood1]